MDFFCKLLKQMARNLLIILMNLELPLTTVVIQLENAQQNLSLTFAAIRPSTNFHPYPSQSKFYSVVFWPSERWNKELNSYPACWNLRGKKCLLLCIYQGEKFKRKMSKTIESCWTRTALVFLSELARRRAQLASEPIRLIARMHNKKVSL